MDQPDHPQHLQTTAAPTPTSAAQHVLEREDMAEEVEKMERRPFDDGEEAACESGSHPTNKRKREEPTGSSGCGGRDLAGPSQRRPRKGILKRRRTDAAGEEEGRRQSPSGEDEADDEETQGTQETLTLEVGSAMSDHKAAVAAAGMDYMDDEQALAFLTSPAVLADWPFMSDIHFLVTVITDMRRPGYPVIYASDSFEGMTLYEKADILGSNCRILQGKCTNKQTVEMLSAAIHRGEQVEAHLLNYRKDGTPFWNKFMALPIKDGSGAVTHYVGIQQDVTLLTEMGSDPRQWTSPEVGMWLDHVDLGDYSLKAVQQDIVGTDLFAEDPSDLAQKLGMTNEQDREYLGRRIKRLKRNPQLSFSSSFSSFDFSHSAISLQALSQIGPKKVRFDPKTFYHPDSQEKITVRCFHRDRVHLFSIHKNTSFSRLRNKIKSILPRLKCAIQQIYEDPESLGGSATAIHPRGNVEARRLAIFTIHSDDDLVQAIARVTAGRGIFGGAPVMRLRLVPPGEAEQLRPFAPPPTARLNAVGV